MMLEHDEASRPDQMFPLSDHPMIPNGIKSNTERPNGKAKNYDEKSEDDLASNYQEIDNGIRPDIPASLPFPSTFPKQYAPRKDPIGAKFDPKIHLMNPIEFPTHIQILKEQQKTNDSSKGVKVVRVPINSPRKKFAEDLAYTDPFRVMSSEGVRILNQIIRENEGDMAICTPRNPKIIRGLGFTSQFVQQFNESPELLEHLSTFANVGLIPHPMVTNYSQINFGEAPISGDSVKPADIWHLDSVDYVLVVMLTEGFEGGELLVSTMDPNEAMQKIRTDTLPHSLTTKIKYPGPGYGIFMQGCRIAHAVAPLKATKEGLSKPSPIRVTAVNSYASRNAMRIDRPTIYNALSQNHTKRVYDSDYLRNVSWRCIEKLEILMKHPTYDNTYNDKPGDQKVDTLLDDTKRDGETESNNIYGGKFDEDLLDLVIDQLSLARDLIKGKKNLSFDIPLSSKVQMKQGNFHNIASAPEEGCEN